MKAVRQAQCYLAPFALAFFAVGGYKLQQGRSFLPNAVQAEGTVIGYEKVPGQHTRSFTYAPAFQYRTGSGQTWTAVSEVANNPPAYAIGQHIPVLYDSAVPQRAHIAKFSEIWGAALAFGLIGLVLCGVTLGLFLVR